MSLLVRFFYSTPSLNPLYYWRAFSMYSLAEMASPSEFVSYKLKSLRIHNNCGKYLDRSSGSEFSSLSWMFLAIPAKTPNYSIICSSIAPTELYISKLDRRVARVSVSVSWVRSAYNPPVPSVSMTRYCICCPSLLMTLTGFVHTQRPLVHAFIVLPTSKPYCLIYVDECVTYSGEPCW